MSNNVQTKHGLDSVMSSSRAAGDSLERHLPGKEERGKGMARIVQRKEYYGQRMGSRNERRPKCGKKNEIKIEEKWKKKRSDQVEGIHEELKNYAREAGGYRDKAQCPHARKQLPRRLEDKRRKEWQETN